MDSSTLRFTLNNQERVIERSATPKTQVVPKLSDEPDRVVHAWETEDTTKKEEEKQPRNRSGKKNKNKKGMEESSVGKQNKPIVHAWENQEEQEESRKASSTTTDKPPISSGWGSVPTEHIRKQLQTQRQIPSFRQQSEGAFRQYDGNNHFREAEDRQQNGWTSFSRSHSFQSERGRQFNKESPTRNSSRDFEQPAKSGWPDPRSLRREGRRRSPPAMRKKDEFENASAWPQLDGSSANQSRTGKKEISVTTKMNYAGIVGKSASTASIPSVSSESPTRQKPLNVVQVPVEELVKTMDSTDWADLDDEQIDYSRIPVFKK